MLKRVLSSLLLVVVLMQSLSTLLTLGAFQMKRQYYAEVLCINRDRPELACQGKCVLMQKLQNEYDNQEQQNSQTLQKLLELDWNWTVFLPTPWQLSPLFCTETPVSMPLSPLTDRRSQTYGRGIFHPPIA